MLHPSFPGPPASLSAAAAEPGRAAAERVLAVDVFRGVTIIAVVAHHLTGMALRHAQGGADLHLSLAWVNRTLHFVVPAFVFITALVLTRSALRRFTPGQYYGARVRTALLPYLLWTGLYVLFRVATGQDKFTALNDPARWLVWVQYGKGYFHLYFLLIVLQFYLLLPLLLPLWRRRPPFWAALLGASGLQGLVFGLNHVGVLNFRFPGTMVWWYIPALTLGMYFGSREGAFENLWRRGRLWIVGAALLALLWYVPLSVARLEGARVSTLAYSAANWVYTAAAVLGLFGASHLLVQIRPRWCPALVLLSTVSLQVYLIHPAILWGLERLGFPGRPAAFVTVLAVYGVIALGMPALLARLLAGTAASRWLFGR